MILVGTGANQLVHFMNFNIYLFDGYVYLMGWIQSMLITAIIWEGVLRFDSYINTYFPWERQALKRILLQILFVFFYTSFVLFTITLFFDTYVCKLRIRDRNSFYLFVLIISVLISLFIVTLEISVQFFRNWKQSLVQLEHYKTETAHAQLENIKSQINPHFLFNNMSILSSLVYKDQDKAVSFIHQLSQVYRYLLENAGQELRTLEEEIQFISSYTYLLNIRYSPNLVFRFDIEEEKTRLLIPPLAIQLLIENAIKHNIVSSEQPLTISISTNGDKLIVENNLQLRISKLPSGGTGLKNISLRYRYFTDREPEISKAETTFMVKIPLLQPV